MSGRILIIQMAKLGDFIQSTPLLANLRRNRPGAKIILAAEQPAVLEAARLSPLVDETLAIQENGPVPPGEFEAVYTLNSHLRAISLAAGVKTSARFGPTLQNKQTRFTPAQIFLMELMRIDRRLGRFNLVDIWLSLADPAQPTPLVWEEPNNSHLNLPSILKTGPQGGGGGKFFGESPDWGSTCLTAGELLSPNRERTEKIFPPPPPGERHETRSAQFSGRLAFKIGLQLGSKNHLRRWPVEDFVGLCLTLASSGLNFVPVLLGSADERALGLKFKKLLAGRGPEPINLIGATNLQSLGAVTANLDLLITADTGVMHLAAAVKTPVLALFFGPAYGPETGPYGPGHLIYQALAPCGPCRESDQCRERQCRSRPDPVRAARLAEKMLKGQPLDEDPTSPWPEGHRVWRTEIDGFGQSLRPLGRPPLTKDELLAVVLTEAGRGIIRPAYRPSAAGVTDLMGAYRLPEKMAFDLGRLRGLKAAGSKPVPGLSPAYQARALELARSLGLEIA